jgi:DinB superfamily
MQSIADELTRIVDLAAIELRAISDNVAAVKRGPAAWSIKEILGHLIDSAANNHQRFVRAQQVREFSFPGYEQATWVASQNYQARPWPDIVDMWVLYNHHLAHVIRGIPASAADVSCRIGANEPVPLSFLVDDYVVHLRHHLKQIEDHREA